MGFVVVSPRYEPARKRICIVISSAQNLRASERANERALFSQDDDNFSSHAIHTRAYACSTVYFRASIRLVSYPVSRATRSSLIAAGRLFPAHERAIFCAIPASHRNVHSSQTYYSELKGCIYSQKRIELNQILIQNGIALTALYRLLNIKPC